MFLDVDFRNGTSAAQAIVIDQFFQDHTIEFWTVTESVEVIFGTYDENNTAGATRFMIFDVGAGGIKGNILTLNSDTGIATFVSNNEIIKMILVENRKLLIQYIARP